MQVQLPKVPLKFIHQNHQVKVKLTAVKKTKNAGGTPLIKMQS